MRILYYNWVPSRHFASHGGGVSIYQESLIAQALARGHEVAYLTSGTAFSAIDRRVHLRVVSETIDPRLREFEVVNSPVLAPSFFAFDALEEYFEDTTVARVLGHFLQREGPFDVVHFNNLEGLPLTCLRLKDSMPGARFVYSLHNYFLFCPQVNLWYRDRERCDDYHDGARCVGCNVFPVSSYHIRLSSKLDDVLRRCGLTPTSRLAVRVKRGLELTVDAVGRGRTLGRRLGAWWTGAPAAGTATPAPALIFANGPALAGRYRQRRTLAVEYVNRHVDVVHAVSDRVRAIAVDFGVDAAKVVTSYIGTRCAERFDRSRVVRRHDGVLHLGYLGYLRPDKGFYFLVESLERMPSDLAARIAVTVAGPASDPAVVERLRAIGYRFRSIRIYDRYAHDSLPGILEGVHLGVVPVLWEDNLPQVAIEFVSHGVPVLTSDLGGAREIAAKPAFVFRAGSIRAFHERVRTFADHRDQLADFWDGPLTLRTVTQHFDELLRLYSGSPSRDSVVAAS